METLVASPSEPTDAEYEAMLDKIRAEIKELNAQWQDHRPEIKRLKAETLAILVAMGAKL